MTDKSPDRLSDCSVLTEDSYKTAKFDPSDDDSMAKMSDCQGLYFSVIANSDAKFDVFDSEAETFCEDEVVEPKVTNSSAALPEANPSFDPQHVVMVKPLQEIKKCEEEEEGAVFTVSNEHFVSVSDILNNTCALEYLDRASSSSAPLTRSRLLRESLYLKFDPLVKNMRPFDAPSRSDGENQHLDSTGNVASTSPVPQQKHQEVSYGEGIPTEAAVEDGQTDKSNWKNENFPKPNGSIVRADSQLSTSCLLEEQMKTLGIRLEEASAEHRELLEKYKCLSTRLNEGQLALQELQSIRGLYEATVNGLNAAVAKASAEADSKLEEAVREKNKIVDDLRRADCSQAELFKLVEEMRRTSGILKQNERSLKEAVEGLKERIALSEERGARLNEYANKKIGRIQSATHELVKLKNSELAALKMQRKKYEVMIKSYQEESMQKSDEISSLISLCNDLSKCR
uniref:TACC_C domain-containing protein n=1 Tax=Trichuris muris TaxID=70415 RepID=A0A5S6QL97_TRIMR